ncbi:MAG: TonB-dependent receptor, partial [Bacteroidia bacterium]|nr:TonB-dependent receptor [Bacteroidia bacterium]
MKDNSKTELNWTLKSSFTLKNNISLTAHIVILFISLFINNLNARAQAKTSSNKISGSISDDFNKPLAHATINVLRMKDSTLVKTSLTDVAGNFIFENIPTGNYQIVATMVGYKKAYSKLFTVSETIALLKLAPMQLFMETKTLKEIVVIAQNPFIERKMDKLVINVAGSSVSAGSTAMEVLEKAPGVTIDKDDNITMKGKQGVLIMLDGKLTYMSNADVSNMLRSMPSNQIESIELITSPSARYDASGTSGIINIKSKKNRSMGLNVTLTAGAGYGQTSKYNGGTNLNYRKNNINLFGNYNYADNGGLTNMILNRRVDYLDTITNFDQLNNGNNRRISNSFKGGLDYSINKNHTIGVLINGYDNINNQQTNNNTFRKNNFDQSEAIDVLGNKKDTYRNIAYNLNYIGILDTSGKDLSVDLDYSNYHGKQDELRDNYYTLSDASPKKPLFIKNYAPSQIDVKSIKIDYIHPLNETTKLEVGIKSSLVKTDNDLLLAKREGAIWVADSEYTNRFVYKEDIFAGYLNFSKEFTQTEVQVGFRTEHTHSKGNSITKNAVVDRKYLKLFPSISLSHKINKDHQLGLSFSRRVDRPSYSNLNPFLNFLDEYTFQQGNPDLKPQFSNSFDLSHTYRGSFTTSISYNRTKDARIFVTEQNDITKKTYAIDRNIDKQEVFALNIFAPVPVKHWWKINNNLQIFYMGFKGTLNGKVLKSGQTALNYNMDHSITIHKTLSAETSLQYQSPLQNGIFKVESQSVVNAGFRKTFLNNKANLKFSINDILNTRKNRISTTFQNMNLNFTEKSETQVGRI